MKRPGMWKCIRAALAVIMGVQIIMGIVWTVMNFRAVPGLGDTSEYLMLSETLMPDEYRPILFPLILRVLQRAAGQIQVPYQCILYAGQLFLSAWAVCMTVQVLFDLAGIRASRGTRLFLEAYILSIPLIMWMNLTVLTDSLALTALLWMLAGLTRYLAERGRPAVNWGIIAASYVFQALIRADRQYSCLVMILLTIIIKHHLQTKERMNLKSRKQKFAYNICIPILVCLLSLGAVRFVNSRTQTPGISGRIKTDLSFVLLDRIVYGHFSENYERMPEKVTAVITPEEAEHSDRQNNDCMYILAPRLEDAYGEEEADILERQMAKIVWDHDPGGVILGIAEDILCFIFMPTASFFFETGMADLNKGWTIQCMSSVTPVLTRTLHRWFAATFGLLVIPLLAAAAVFRKKARTRFPQFGLYVIMMVLISLWFGIGDGCPPNDRYQLAGYVTWALLAANAVL